MALGQHLKSVGGGKEGDTNQAKGKSVQAKMSTNFFKYLNSTENKKWWHTDLHLAGNALKSYCCFCFELQ